MRASASRPFKIRFATAIGAGFNPRGMFFGIDRFAARDRVLVAASVALLVLLTTGTASAALRDLQAHGGADRLWLARVEPVSGSGASGGEVTSLFVREKFELTWKRLDPIGSRVVGLANRGSQLAILFPNGDWRLTTDSGLASGQPLPDAAKMVALGSGPDALWALGLIPAPASNASTAPATRPAMAPTSPAGDAHTQPVGIPPAASRPATTPARENTPRLMLYQLADAGWESAGELPHAISMHDVMSFSIGSAGGAVLLAHKVDDRRVRLFSRQGDGAWQAAADVDAPFDVQDYKLLGGTTHPTLWLRAASGVGRVWIRGNQGAPIVRDLGSVPAQAAHAATYANGAIRILWVEDNKVFEQRLRSEDGSPDGDVAAQPLPAVSIGPVVRFWTQLTLSSALVFALAASMRRRQEMQDIALNPEKLPLAPFSARFTAGIIDALPLFVGTWLARSHQSDATDHGFVFTMLVSAGVYLLLTTLVEVIAGRSLGKLLTGLHVVGLDGKPTSVGTRVMRNLLRIIDLPVLPLALILFSPLRQRAGDLAAGTLVVRS